MSKFSAEVLETIPQKPPFLFVDKVIERSEGKIKTSDLVKVGAKCKQAAGCIESSIRG